MADLSYGGGGGGGGYYPPSFDPNNPMGGGGGGGSGAPVLSPEQQAYVSNLSYSVSHISTIDPNFNSDYFNNNFNAQNPYTKYYDVTVSNVYASIYYNIGSFGNSYEIVGYTTMSANGKTYVDPIYRVYDNAYKQFDTSATDAQKTYLSQQQAIFEEANNKAATEYQSSFGNVRDTSLQNTIQQLADIKSQISDLKFQDDITDYLNRISDTDNSKLIAELEQQAALLDADLSKRLLEYWQQQELIRQQSRQDFTYDFNYLSDPYFGRGQGEIYPRFIADGAQQDTKNFFDLNANGEMSDWMAGGSMYDSPRAGDILFNAMGNLNTTVFLGLENKNFGFDMTASYANAEVFKSFGTLAGDSRFSVLNFGS